MYEPAIRMDIEGIPGWTGFLPFYDRVIELAPPRSTLIEVGVFCGRSLAHLAAKAREADKGLRIVGVDSFAGSPEHNRQFEVGDGTLIGDCYHHLKKAGVIDDVTLIVADSVRAASLIRDWSAFMVFIDADHSLEGTRRDIDAWKDKVESGGFLAGDDDIPIFPGVQQAVAEFVTQDEMMFSETAELGKPWWSVRYF